MTAPIELVRSRLDAGGWQPKGRDDSFQSLCPAHEDRESSLSVTAGDDGRVLLNCFAGCDATAVVAALGLEMRDLFERSDPTVRRLPRRRRAKRKPNQLPDSAFPVDRVLARYAPNYRATTAANFWLATCKVCCGGDLWIHAELDEDSGQPSGPVTLRCAAGCITNVRRRAA